MATPYEAKHHFHEIEILTFTIPMPPGSANSFPAHPLQGIDLESFSRQFHEGTLTAEATTEAYLQRIGVLDPVIGAFRAVDASDALQSAREIDSQRRAGLDLGPLMGMPIAVKEIFRVEGLPFGAGTDIDIDDLVPRQGPFVDALKQQGCVLLGITKTTEFAAATINSGKSMPWNPCDAAIKRVCGGSSHGSAAALAAGLCAFAIGTDTGGSVRLPAALCGLVGFKPSMGIWSTDGVFPLSPTFDTVGVFSHSVGDARLVFATLTGRKALAMPAPSEVCCGRAMNLFEGLRAPVADAMERAMSRLAGEGVRFIDIDLPEAVEVGSVFGRILAGELVHYLGRERLLTQRERIDPVTWARIERELDMDGQTLAALRRRQRELVALIQRRIDGLDAIVCPTTPLTPDPVADVGEPARAIAWNRESGRNTRPGNLFGLCGISLPVHAPGELPVGLQLLGSSGGDDRLLAVAAGVESVLGLTAPPILEDDDGRKRHD
jgi:aspartyl-tRNA(Asn)/glutamyl-tRNA(Gln) amidotransferase subunit A